MDELGRRDGEGVARASTSSKCGRRTARRAPAARRPGASHGWPDSAPSRATRPERQRMGRVDRADAARRRRDRDLQLLGERAAGRRRRRRTARPARRDHRALGGRAACRPPSRRLRGRRRSGRRCWRSTPWASGVSSAAASRNTSNGTSSTTGPGPPGHHGLPRLAHRERHHLAAGRLEHPLAIGAHGRGKVGLVMAVEFLEGAAVELAGRHVAGHRQERHRIEIRSCRARSAGWPSRGRRR